MNKARMVQQLVLHEDLRLVPYKDSLGNLTVGVGYNVRARGWNVWNEITNPDGPEDDVDQSPVTITEVGCYQVLSADIDRVEAAVKVHWPYYEKLDEVRQRVAVDMAFNMGLGALAFKKTIAAVERQDWSTATRELYKSRWSSQVGRRSSRLGQMLLTGKDYDS